ncbi:TetR/AcrR family transcriptional regulator [Microbacterium sp. STN6]|uniref:TetR/AcrR family transcriptional regulator n=1 Tax=Microbacterium sp. STN6 TaxID=2995588 RepID=UPI002260E82B|nr:TetR/AcrR family transcriptional regulator [Microbacterium sp. STN6]MCX7522957.1 TetR/AcrR family transcriptional regulator [Microbacterium sp. STN6]
MAARTVQDTAAHPARKRGRPTADERASRRQHVLDEALGVFLEHGYANATVEQLARAGGVTKRTIYAYFGDKAGVFSEMVRSLATTVSSLAPDGDTLESLATRIVYRLHSAELVGLHRLVIAESMRFPELAQTLHDNGDARHIARLAEHLADERPADAAGLAPSLFILLLGEEHRKRLLGLVPAISEESAHTHAQAALATLGLERSPLAAMPLD